MFFVDHNYLPVELMRVEATLTPILDLEGCHHFAAMWTDDRIRVTECIVFDMGQSLALLQLGGLVGKSLIKFWSTKQDAFTFVSWFKTTHPRASVTWHK